jgi:hypothetical protein
LLAERDQLLTIIANACQFAGVHGASEAVLDVLPSPETATCEQIEAKLDTSFDGCAGAAPACSRCEKQGADEEAGEEVADRIAPIKGPAVVNCWGKNCRGKCRVMNAETKKASPKTGLSD